MPEQNNDAAPTVQDRPQPLEVTCAMPADTRQESIAGIADLNRKEEESKGFDLSDPKTWTNIFNSSDPKCAQVQAGNADAALRTNFDPPADGSPETQDGQLGATKQNGKTATDKQGGPTDKKDGVVTAAGTETGGETNPDGKKVEGATKLGDKTKIDDKVKTEELSKEGVLKDYSETLVRAGFSEAEAAKIAGDTYARLEKTSREGHLQGSPEEQMKRIDTAHREVLDRQPGGTLPDGQKDYLTGTDRQNIVKDSAQQIMDPEKFVNQGQHMTCALHSMLKQELEAGDPAKVAERTRDLVNTGSTIAREQDRKGPNGEIIPGQQRVVHVDSLSLKPDFEASRSVNSQNYGDNGKQGPAGQVQAAYLGQLAADLQSERDGKPTSAQGIDKAANVYMAAHADERGARRGQTSTNEGMFARDENGKLKFQGEGPQVDIWDVAHLNRANGGAEGAVFASASLFRDGKGQTPPDGYPPDLKITTFKNTDELRTKLKEFQDQTGQSGQIGVNAPFLPGGGRNGHGMHAMNISLNEDGSFRMDNNWGTKSDLGRVSDQDVDTATNKDKWKVQNPGSGGGGQAPDDRTKFGPEGKKIDEDADLKDKRDDEKRRKEQEEEEKAREREAQRKEAERVREALLREKKLDERENSLAGRRSIVVNTGQPTYYS